MNMPAIGFFLFAGLLALIILILLVDYGVHLYVTRRELRAMRIRNSNAKKWCITIDPRGKRSVR